jgi:DNA-3-methyladenine glycosylase II
MTHATPPYWDEAIQHLRADSVMAAIIAQHPEGQMHSRGTPFYTLMRSIVGQQISVRAADAVWGRVMQVVQHVMTAEAVLRADVDVLRSAGLSSQKVTYVQHLALFFVQHRITSPDYWMDMPDDAVIKHLTQIKGIGRWSAEMFLMFGLLRPDVYPLDDIGLQRALFMHYAVPIKPFDKVVAQALGQAWQPYRSVAVWYLWRSIDPSDVQY